MIQTQWVVEQLHQQSPNLEIIIEKIRTTGDRVTDLPLSQIGGDGVFVTEIERGLQERRLDLAVHSLKDLPTVQPDGLQVIVVGPREDVRDILVLPHPLDDQAKDPEGAETGSSNGRRSAIHPAVQIFGEDAAPRIGTCSLRRSAQIRRLWPSAQILPLRGNVDTRLRKLEAGEYDAIILAAAGLRRLGQYEHLENRLIDLPTSSFLPAPGQGALAVEIRTEPALHTLLVSLQNKEAQAATDAERAFMRHLGAGCYLPVAAYAFVQRDELRLTGLVISLDGQRQVEVSQSIIWQPDQMHKQAEWLGVSVAEQALEQGAHTIIQELNVARG